MVVILGAEIPAKVPWELSLLWETERYGALLWPGGILNQPHLTMDLLNMCGNVRNQINKIDAEQKESMQRFNEQLRQFTRPNY